MENTSNSLPQIRDTKGTLVYRMYSDDKIVKVVRKRPYSRTSKNQLSKTRLPEISNSLAQKTIAQNKSLDTINTSNTDKAPSNKESYLHKILASFIITHARQVENYEPKMVQTTEEKPKENRDRSQSKIRIRRVMSQAYYKRKQEILGDYKKDQELIRKNIIDSKKLLPNYKPNRAQPKTHQSLLGKCTDQVDTFKYMLANTSSSKKNNTSFERKPTLNQTYSLDNLKNLCNAAQSSISNLKKRLDDVYPPHLRPHRLNQTSVTNNYKVPHRNDKKEHLLAKLKFELLRDFNIKKYKI
jgi:hypothetical protein